MASIQSELILLQYIGENIALFCGGLFSGATLYICLTERPPRTALGFADLLALSRANSGPTNAFLIALSALTALAAMIATVAGAGIWWFAGGLAHVAALFVLLTKVTAIVGDLAELQADDAVEAAAKKLLQRQTVYFSALCLIGLAAQYLFIVKR